MPFIPHTQADVDEMLAEIGVSNIDALFDEIPNELTSDRLDHVPEGMSELTMLQHMAERAEQDQGYTCFLGGGSYDHHIPSAVWDLTKRSGTRMTRGWPLSSKKTLTSPFSSVFPIACRRISSILPGSISAVISSPGCMP